MSTPSNYRSSWSSTDSVQKERHLQMPTDFETPRSSFIELQPIDNIVEGKRITAATWRSLFVFTQRSHGFTLGLALLVTLATALVKPIAAVLYGKIFAVLAKFGSGSLSPSETVHEISGWCVALAGLGAGDWVVEAAFFSYWVYFGELQAKSARETIFVDMLERKMEWYDQQEDGIGPLLTRIQTQIRELQLATSQPLGFVAFEIIGTCATLGVAFYYSWQLTLVILSVVPIAAVLLFLVTSPLGPAVEVQKRELTQASKYTSAAITSINTVKAYNGQEQEIWQYLTTIKRGAASYLIQARCNAAQHGVTKLVVIGLFVVGFWFGLSLVNKGMNPGVVLTTFYACLTAIQAVDIVLPQWLVLTKGISAGHTLKTIMNEMQEGLKGHTTTGTLRPDSCPGDIEINNVSFAYPSNIQQQVLKDTSFFFPAGETTFVIGTSGSGKSTVGNLLLRYYNPLEGEVLIDGYHINSLDRDWLRQNITLVQQQSILFNETICQNIAFGKHTSDHFLRADIIEAAKTADLDKTLQSLPDGIDTVVGSNGKMLSGGQQQRVAIARARLRDAPILILDESTSALDQKSREKVMSEIRKWRRRKTTIIITHDVSQIHDEEYVYVVEKGRVVQEGYCGSLSGQKHGTFASFMPVGASNDGQDDNLPISHYNSDSRPLVPSAPDSSMNVFEQFLHTQRSPSIGFNNNATGRHNSIMMFGIGTTLATELMTDQPWSSPVVPDEEEQFVSFHAQRSPPVPPAVTSPKQGLPRYSTGPSPALAFQTQLDSHVSYGNLAHVVSPKLITIEVPAGRKKAKKATQNPQTSMLDMPKDSTLAQASLRTIFRSVWPTLVWKEKVWLVFSIISATTVAASTPAFSYTFSRLLQVYYLPRAERSSQALFWALALLAVAIVDGIATYCTHYGLEHVGNAWVSSLRVTALERVLAQSRSWFDLPGNSSSKLNECLDRNAEEMRNLVGRFAGPVYTAAFMLGISVVWAMIICWKLTLVALACAPVTFIIVRLSNFLSSIWESRCQMAAEFTSGIFVETFANIRIVRSLTLETYFKDKHTKATHETAKTGLSRALYSGLFVGAGDSMNYFITALVFYYGTKLTTSHFTDVGSILQVANLLIFGISNSMGMMTLVPQINSSRTTATYMLHLTTLPKNSNFELSGRTRLETPFPIIMDKLDFAYPSQLGTETLKCVSLRLEPGTCTALVGPSGSGKSTIASLLLGLYLPSLPNLPRNTSSTSPPLTFSGVPIQELNIHALRNFISVVHQSSTLFPTSILENITYGLPEDSLFATLNAAMVAAEDAGIHEFVMSLPDGYATIVGEGGQALSGGQAQRIAIARALVRRPRLLILDEATSALDAVSAEAVRETVRKFVQRGNDRGEGVAVVIVSHTVDMMRIADQVVVVEAGRVVERGGFEELRRKGGAFARLIGRGNGGVDSETAQVASEENWLGPINQRNRLTWLRNTSV